MFTAVVFRVTEEPYVCEFAKEVRENPDLRAKLWANAQKEIGITPNFDELRKSYPVADFYNHSFGFSAHVFNDTPVVYTRIWKNANSGIRVSLFVNAKARDPENFCPKGGSQCTPQNFDYKEEDYSAIMTELKRKTNHTTKSFSFIRNPLSHFRSGLTEYFWLWNYGARTPSDAIGRLTPHKLKRFLHTFIDATKPPPKKVFTPYGSHPYNIPHVYPQATVFREQFGPHLIGQIESFDEDWRTIQREFGITAHIWKEMGKREASNDKANVVPSWNALFSKQTKYLRAMCWILLPDYFCFNYQLPVECQDITYKTNISINF